MTRATGPGAYSRRRWLVAYRQAQREGGVGFVGLFPKDHLRGNRKPPLVPESYEVIEQVIAEEYETPRNITAKAAHALASRRCADRGLRCLSYAGFLDFLKARDQTTAVARRKGGKAAAAAVPAFGPADPAVREQARSTSSTSTTRCSTCSCASGPNPMRRPTGSGSRGDLRLAPLDPRVRPVVRCPCRRRTLHDPA